MKKIANIFLLLLLLCQNVWSQDSEAMQWIRGEVSFLSSRNVYVKFASTKGIKESDTLYQKTGDRYHPALLVHTLSSASIVGLKLNEEEGGIKKGDVFYAHVILKKEKSLAEIRAEKRKEREKKHKQRVEKILQKDSSLQASDSLALEEETTPEYKQKIRGRLSASSYNSHSNYGDVQRMRYSFSMRARHIQDSKFSVESYINFRHRIGEWEAVQENLARALKVYTLSASYDISPTSWVSVGRRINPKLSSLGALDGIQGEKRFGRFHIGLLLGSHPDYSDYRYNPTLFQGGAYLSFDSEMKDYKRQQATLGFANQLNHGVTDRRYLYFQYSAQFSKSLSIYHSMEMDLYESVNSEKKNVSKLTNLYVSLRYRPVKKLRLSLSYDRRKNIIYYETYKDYIDRLLNQAHRQGLRLGVNYKIIKYVTWGLNASMRFQNDGGNYSRNLNSYINISRIPLLKMRLSIKANLMQNKYINSRLYGIKASKSFLKKKLNMELYYKRLFYVYKNQELPQEKNISGGSISFRFLKKTSLHTYFERIDNIHSDKMSQRINLKLIQRL